MMPSIRARVVSMPPAGWIASLALAASLAPAATAGLPPYPETPRGSVVDDYFGVQVADPYRWLENSDDPAVAAWTEAENAYTEAFLAEGDLRPAIRHRLTELQDYPRAGVPMERGGRLFFTRNSGLQKQSVWMVQDGIEGTPQLLLDPNTWREDGTAAVSAIMPSPDGRLVVYAVSLSGSDWEELHVRNVDTGKDTEDRIPYVKFTTPAWTPDNLGFFYSRQPTPGTVPAGDENYFPKIYYHRLGESYKQDAFIYDRPREREIGFDVTVTHDGTYLVVEVWAGSSTRSEIYALPLSEGFKKPRPVLTGFDANYHFLAKAGNLFYLLTDKDAPHYRIIGVDPARPDSAHWTTVVPEGPDVITTAQVADQALVVETLHDARSRLALVSPDGGSYKQLDLPDLGSVGRIRSRPGSDWLAFAFTSFLFPTTVYRYDFARGELAPFYRPQIDFDRDAYVTRQVWFESKDGTKVPMFLVHRRNLVLNGNNPVLLTGYGGFDISMTPRFSTSTLFWLEQGGVYALVNLRGGGEFGEAWHRAGMLEKKQNVFDDFIAAAEDLVTQGVTRPERIAIWGGSNGGLLTAACEVQRPALFGAVVIGVPVADMLRYHQFTVARFWIPEYGSSEDPVQFKFLYAYSPLQNVKPGVRYPATLVTTADTDDRVGPGQARKLAATLQADNASGNPILIRIDTRAGHGGGKPTQKWIEERADIYAFILKSLGLPVRTPPTPWRLRAEPRGH